jgi:hypothetical protein
MLFWRRWGKKLIDIIGLVAVYIYTFYILVSMFAELYNWIDSYSYGLYTQGVLGWLQLVGCELIKVSIICVVIAFFVATITFIGSICKSGKGILWVKVGNEYVSRFTLLQETTNRPLL